MSVPSVITRRRLQCVIVLNHIESYLLNHI